MVLMGVGMAFAEIAHAFSVAGNDVCMVFLSFFLILRLWEEQSRCIHKSPFREE